MDNLNKIGDVTYDSEAVPPGETPINYSAQDRSSGVPSVQHIS
jgi:hypothetical protein